MDVSWMRLRNLDASVSFRYNSISKSKKDNNMDDWQLLWDAVGAMSTLLAAVFALMALRQAKLIFKSQQALSKSIHQQQRKLSQDNERRQTMFAQRQLFVPFYEKLKDLRGIDCNHPIWPDVVYAVNFIDLLGIAWEGSLVEEEILKRAFGHIVVDFYDEIKKCVNPPEGQKSGPQMLEDSIAATRLYNYLKRTGIKSKNPKPIR